MIMLQNSCTSTYFLSGVGGQVEDEDCEEGYRHARYDQVDRVEQSLAAHCQVERYIWNRRSTRLMNDKLRRDLKVNLWLQRLHSWQYLFSLSILMLKHTYNTMSRGVIYRALFSMQIANPSTNQDSLSSCWPANPPPKLLSSHTQRAKECRSAVSVKGPSTFEISFHMWASL